MIDIKEADFELIKAHQQILGFIANKNGYSLTQLIDGMGLNASEWNDLKKYYSLPFLTDIDISDIDEHLSQK